MSTEVKDACKLKNGIKNILNLRNDSNDWLEASNSDTCCRMKKYLGNIWPII